MCVWDNFCIGSSCSENVCCWLVRDWEDHLWCIAKSASDGAGQGDARACFSAFCALSSHNFFVFSLCSLYTLAHLVPLSHSAHLTSALIMDSFFQGTRVGSSPLTPKTVSFVTTISTVAPNVMLKRASNWWMVHWQRRRRAETFDGKSILRVSSAVRLLNVLVRLLVLAVMLASFPL